MVLMRQPSCAICEEAEDYGKPGSCPCTIVMAVVQTQTMTYEDGSTAPYTDVIHLCFECRLTFYAWGDEIREYVRPRRSKPTRRPVIIDVDIWPCVRVLTGDPTERCGCFRHIIDKPVGAPQCPLNSITHCTACGCGEDGTLVVTRSGPQHPDTCCANVLVCERDCCESTDRYYCQDGVEMVIVAADGTREPLCRECQRTTETYAF